MAANIIQEIIYSNISRNRVFKIMSAEFIIDGELVSDEGFISNGEFIAAALLWGHPARFGKEKEPMRVSIDLKLKSKITIDII